MNEHIRASLFATNMNMISDMNMIMEQWVYEKYRPPRAAETHRTAAESCTVYTVQLVRLFAVRLSSCSHGCSPRNGICIPPVSAAKSGHGRMIERQIAMYMD